ncbi:MAG: hypothetical protein NXI23_00855 [Bacteroidetes bacterium]|jgi:hypothetical protein|nr:hypothetical protein [Bacteroidota bacterium]
MSNQKDEFYIGWQPEAPDSFAKKSKKTTIILGVLILILAGAIVFSQRGFATAFFEFGNQTTVEGVLVLEPVPMLRVNDGKTVFGREMNHHVLLVGFGKAGARKTIHDIERRDDIYRSLENNKVRIKGTLIYKDGKSVLEMTEGINSIIAIGGKEEYDIREDFYGDKTLKGEIIDTKCYFGVMKPGHGKPHRSCAIRCISGGIPPAFWIKNEAGENEYLMMLDEKGQQLGEEILDYVGESISICGKVEKRDDWLYIYVDLAAGFQRLNSDDKLLNCF